jgi:hypothetical protein
MSSTTSGSEGLCESSRIWRNWSGDVAGMPECIYTPRTRLQLVAIVRKAESQNPGRRVRAYGSGWSFTDVAYTDDYLVETTRLNRTLEDVYPDPTRSIGRETALYHVEAGVTLQDLYQRLDRDGSANAGSSRWALPTLPGAAGQTLAGAISTGVHGADLHLPPLSDHIEALHLVGGGGQEHWIETENLATDPDRLHDAYPGITIHRDTDLLRAVAVGLGCAGIVYAAVVRVIPQFWLELRRRSTSWEEVRDQLDSVLQAPDQRFLQIAISPSPGTNGERRCWVTTEREIAPVASPPQLNIFGQFCRFRRLSTPVSLMAAALLALGLTRPNGRGRSALAIAAAGTALLATRLATTSAGDIVARTCNWATAHGYGRLVPRLIERVIAANQHPGSSTPLADVSYRILDTGNPPTGCYRALSSAFFFSVDDPAAFAEAFETTILSVLDADIAAGRTPVGYVSLRFMRQSESPLAMQRWERTCSVEVALLQGAAGNQALLRRLQAAVVAAGGTVHWGQYHDLTPADVRKMYPRLGQWQSQLRRVRGDSMTFSNEFTRRLEI